MGVKPHIISANLFFWVVVKEKCYLLIIGN